MSALSRITLVARALFDATTPYAADGGYVDFLTEDESDRVGACCGVSLERLAGIKHRFDPANLFRMNLNIAPVPPRQIRRSA